MDPNFGLELSGALIVAALVFIIIRSVRKDKYDGRGFMGGPMKSGGDSPPKRKK